MRPVGTNRGFRLLKLAGAVAVVLAAGGTAEAQITSYVDETGKRVFINASPPGVARNRAPRGGTPFTRRYTPPAVLARQAEMPDRATLEQMADEAAERHKLDPALVRAVIETESSWDPLAVSSKGAQGLMQLMPATARELGVRDPFDPEQNLDGGVRHLRALLERYDGDLERALAAYNAGGGAVDRAGGVPRYAETVAYVQKITDAYFAPGSGRSAKVMKTSRPMYRIVDERGRVVFTNN